jgi:hypothetical protein
MMTAKERQQMQRLEIENRELRERVAKDAEVWRDQALELIDLRAKLELVALAIRGDT